MQPVIGIGAATWDHFYVVDDFPHGEGVVQARASVFTGGGPVATALSVIAAHQVPTQLLDVQGDDLIGRAIRQELIAQGVGLDALDVHVGASSAHAVVLVRASDAARHITYFPSSAPALILTEAQRSLIAHSLAVAPQWPPRGSRPRGRRYRSSERGAHLLRRRRKTLSRVDSRPRRGQCSANRRP